MKHNHSKGEHVERLMRGHNHPKSSHVEKLMGGHQHHEQSPADRLMRKNLATGGSANDTRSAGPNIEPEYKKGGRPHGGRREHHFWGELAGAAIPPLVGWGINKIKGMTSNKGDRENEPLRRAIGGSGKVRKGMMTEKGKIR